MQALPAWIIALANHMWQSTLFAIVAWLLAIALRDNRAHVRHWVWLTASVKFLVPFAVLVTFGQQLGWKSTTSRAALPSTMTFAMDAVSQPFSHSQAASTIAARASENAVALSPVVSLVLLTIWITGCAMILGTWWIRWHRIAAIVRSASPVAHGRELEALRRLETASGIKARVTLATTSSSIEPGVFGIVRPVLLWPRGVGQRLTDEQVEAVLSHEVAHVRRRDNLAALLHMSVEALFWFHPLVWWIGARLVDERERVCDEDVLRLGNAPETYAESVLRTCEVSIASRLACVSGVSGSDLKTRIERIMRCDERKALNAARKFLLAATGFAAIAAPIVIGVVAAPHRLLAQSSAAPAGGPAPKFEVASIKTNKSADLGSRIEMQRGGRFTAMYITLSNLIRLSFQLQDFQIVGGPEWITSQRFDIMAKAEGDVPPAPPGTVGPLQLMIRSLLEERFQLVIHHETRDLPIYALVVARNDGRLGSKLQPSTADCQAMAAAARGRGGPLPGSPLSMPNGRPVCGMRTAPGQVMSGGLPVSQLASTLSAMVQRTVVDRTGLTGNFDVELTFTPDQMPSGQPPPGAPPLPPIDPNGPSIFTAIQEQLGLRLVSTQGPVDVLVIDSVQHPTED